MKRKTRLPLLFSTLALSVLTVAYVDPFNTPPIFIAPDEGEVVAYSDTPFELDIKIEDLDGDELRVRALNLPEWCVFDPYLLQIKGRPSRLDKGEYYVTIKADDGRTERARRITLKVAYGHSAAQHLKESLNHLWETEVSGLLGASAAIATADGELSSVVIGHEDVARRRAVEPNHRFRVASVSKLFTSALILRLADQGYFSLDDQLTDLMPVPGLPNGDRITIRQLLSHTAGVIDHLNHPSFYKGNWKNRRWSAKDIYRFVAVRRARFEPGEGYAYSNTGYYLLGELAAHVIKQPLADVFQEYIFAPAGLNQTSYDDFSTRQNRIDSLAENNRAYEYHQSAVGAAGAIISTPADMARFGQALFSGKLISQAALEAMQTDIGFTKGGDHYGLGMRIWDDYGIRHQGHTGLLMGYRSILMYLPEYQATIAISTHDSRRNWYSLVNGVMLDMADYLR